MIDPVLPRKTGRGGRIPGSKNKRTIYREKKLIASQAGKAIDLLENKSFAEVTKINGEDFIAESLNAMGEALGFFLQMARSEADPKQRRVYYHDVLTAGEKIAPFYRQRWSRFPEQNGGLAKVDSGLDYAANFSSPACVA